MSGCKVKIGIIGVGQIGKWHIENYSHIPGAELVAAADVNAAELAAVAAKNRIPHTYEDFREMLKREDIEAVDVCLHNNLHTPVTMAALAAGKHVYCEKPMAGSYADARAMHKAARKARLNLSIQLSTLFSKETRAAKLMIDSGRLGRLYHVRSTGFRRRGRPYVDGYGTSNFVQKEIASGGALYDMGVYHIAQLIYLLGLPEVESVSGKTYQEMDMNQARKKKGKFNVEELGLGFVKFAGGLTMDIIEAWAIYLNNLEGSSIVGSKGGLRLDPFSFHTTADDMDMNATFDLGGADYRWHQLGADGDAYDSPQHHWVAALQGRVKLLPTDTIALQTMLISEAIYLSDKLGREVRARDVEKASKSTALRI